MSKPLKRFASLAWISHRAKAAVLMTAHGQRLERWRFLGFIGAPGGRALPMLVVAAMLLNCACRREMMDQPKAKTFSESSFFTNGTNARPIPPNTVPRGEVQHDEAFYTGMINGVYVTQLPMRETPELLRRGRESHDVFCAECHGRLGEGQGPVVQHGFPSPLPYYVDRLRNAPLGYFFDVMTKGHGTMASYSSQVDPVDRWALAAYIRALQLTQNAKSSDLQSDEQKRLEKSP